MKKRLTIKNIIFILFAFIGTINAKEKFAFSWYPANIGYGFNFSSGRNDLEFSAELFNFFFDNNKTKNGINLSAANIRSNMITKESEKTITEMNFLNFCIYRNFLNETDIIFGPFSSMQYINLRNWKTVDFKDVTVNAGLKFLQKIEDDDDDVKKNYGKFVRIGMELGYRYNYYDKHKFYFNISIDLISIIFMFDKIAGRFKPNNTQPEYYRIDYF